jgi:hypothetical protein
LLEFTLAGRSVGDSIALAPGQHVLHATVRLRSIVAVDSLEVVRNGEVIARLHPISNGTRADTSFSIPVKESGWFLLRAYAPAGRHPVFDLMPLGTTSPIYVTVGGVPIRSARDARYFLQWVDRLRANAAAFAGWNDARERSQVLERLDVARAAWVRLGGEAVIP